MTKNITTTKRDIKEMILKDSEITKILLNGKENNYENVKELVGRKIFNYINDDCCTTSSYIRLSYDVDYIPSTYEEMATRGTIIVQPVGFCNPCDDNYNSYIDILSEKILEDVLKTFKPIEYRNVAEPIECNSIRRKITFTIE